MTGRGSVRCSGAQSVRGTAGYDLTRRETPLAHLEPRAHEREPSLSRLRHPGTPRSCFPHDDLSFNFEEYGSGVPLVFSRGPEGNLPLMRDLIGPLMRVRIIVY